MIHIKVQYDAQTRTFKLLDAELRIVLEGDGLYDLLVPLTLSDTDPLDDFMAVNTNAIAHA
jgi:hypothetical protein